MSEICHAEIDQDGLVKRVLVITVAEVSKGVWGNPANWITTKPDGSVGKNYAGIGYTYDNARKAFITPKPFQSWALDETTCKWKAPKAMPNDGKLYVWNETLGDWVVVGL